MKPWLFFPFTYLFVLSCQSNPQSIDKVDHQAEVNVALKFVDAYNQQDVNGMLRWVHPDIKYMYISHGELFQETVGKPALQQFLLTYFTSTSKVYSEILSSVQQGPFIQQVEKARWFTATGINKSQCSLSVYQVQAELIVNVWYFDVFQCPDK